MSGRESGEPNPYSDELAEVEQSLQLDAERLQEYIQELDELGVEPKGAVQGLVDFPCLMDGRIVYLCWQLGEAEVLFWHELEAGFAGRQKLTADSGAADGALGEQSGGV